MFQNTRVLNHFRRNQYMIFFIALAGLFFALVPRCCRNACATDQCIFYADQVDVQKDAVIVPVCIKNNPGLMGVLLTFTYNPDEIEIKNIERTEKISNGIFDNNLGRQKKSFNIAWAGVSPSSGDGTIFYLKIKTKKPLVEPITIHVKYSKEDTFDEKLELLDCVCEDIIIKQENEEIDQKPKAGMDAAKSIESSRPDPSDAGELTARQNELVEQVIKNNRPETIHTAVSDVLDEINCDKPSDLKALNDRRISKLYKKLIAKLSVSETEIKDNLTSEDQRVIIQKLYHLTVETPETTKETKIASKAAVSKAVDLQSKEKTEKKHHAVARKVFGGIVLGLALFIFVILIYRRKR